MALLQRFADWTHHLFYMPHLPELNCAHVLVSGSALAIYAAYMSRHTSKNHSQARGLMGSPTVPSSLRLLRSCLVTHLLSKASNALISVGAV